MDAKLIPILMSNPNFTRTCAAITPTNGSNQVVNSTFDADTDWSKGTGWSIAAGVAASDGSQPANSNLQNTSAGVSAVGTWYYASMVVTRSAGQVRYLINGTDTAGFKAAAGTYVFAGRSTAAGRPLVQADADFVGTIDNVTRQPITFSTMRTLVGNHARNGTYWCTPTVADDSVTGILIEYLDDNNFVMVIVDRGAADVASLVSRIGGTYAVARTGSITYVPEAVVMCIVNGTTHTLKYNGTQVGADVTIDNSGLGTQIHGFNTLAGNTVGTVSTNP